MTYNHREDFPQLIGKSSFRLGKTLLAASGKCVPLHQKKKQTCITPVSDEAIKTEDYEKVYSLNDDYDDDNRRYDNS